MQLILGSLVFLGGFLLPVQVAVNSRLGASLGSPVRSASVSFIVGLVALLFVMATLDARIAQFAGVKGAISWSGGLTAPLWAYLGGLCGAFYVLLTIVALPRLGAVATIAVALMGQQAASVLIDTLGLFGAPRIPLSWPRVVGVALVATGVLMVQHKR